MESFLRMKTNLLLPAISNHFFHVDLAVSIDLLDRAGDSTISEYKWSQKTNSSNS